MTDEHQQEQQQQLVQSIERNFNRHLESSRVLASTVEVPEFSRSEINLGKLLGSGGFSHVYELDKIQLLQESDDKRRLDMEKRANSMVRGRSPFAVKHIQPEMLENNPKDFRRAAVDLMVEAHFLASLQHEHIVSIHGWAAGGALAYNAHDDDDLNTPPVVADGFFLILDALRVTLDNRLLQWQLQMKRYQEPSLQNRTGASLRQIFFNSRLQVAADIASAISHLHSKHIIYRDLKPSNVGFDVEGVVKVFDFGLSRELPNEDGATIDDVFHMSGKIGSMRYMAPEVVLSEPYNQKADVYSFSLVMWEILALEKPYGAISKQSHRFNVVENDVRPEIDASWAYGICKVLKQGWRTNDGRRPAMKDIHSTLAANVEQLRKSRQLSAAVVGNSRSGSTGYKQPTRRYPSLRPATTRM